MLEKTGLKIDISNFAPFDFDDKKVPLSTFKGSVLVMAGGGRGAIEDVREWSYALEVACKAISVRFVGLAFVFHVPAFIPKNVIKDGIRGSGAISPLLFWEEESVKAMEVSDYNSSNIFVVDKQGILRYLLVEKFSMLALEKVMSQAKKLIDEGGHFT